MTRLVKPDIAQTEKITDVYVLLFGIGSMLGMGALSTVIAVPLAVSARWLTWANRGLQLVVGLITIGIGAMTIYSTALA